MCYCSSSSSSQPGSPLLPQHHDDKSTYAVVDPTTTNDPTPPPLSPVPDDSLPAAVDPNNKTKSFVHCLPSWEAALLVFLVVLIFIGVPAMVITYGQLRPYSPHADVVSAFVSVSNTNNNSSGLTGTAGGRLLTTNWVIVLHLKNYVGDCCPSLHLYRIQASLFRADGHRPLASTRQFTTRNIDNAVHDGHDMTFSIQFKAEGVDVGKHVVAAGIPGRDYGTRTTLRFKVVILVWARLKPQALPARYYLARISCDPFWIGSSNIGISTISSDHKESCHTHVIRQSKPSFLNSSRANIKDEKIN
ncbi:unnamed protein product [Linum trigynum]|uniref:Late embryogenesis abundant protein LEA-2 subgroup domain-containing protein n=1 Tax=Linum trigynum TaxID=586398 RepID=A0AAV2F1U5_9ROSI